jgi:hypothetical protein
MPRNVRGVSTLILIPCVALVLAGLVAIYVLMQHSASSGPAFVTVPQAPLSAEQKAYFPYLDFNNLRMSAAENFLGNTLTYLDASVTNKGTKAVRNLEVELNFVDALDQVVLRERAHPLTHRAAPLKPGETRSFRVTFEHMPVDWNQAPPAIRPVRVEF